MKKNLLLIITGIIFSIFIEIGPSYSQQGLFLGIQATPQFSWLLNQDDYSNSNFKYLGTFKASAGIYGQYNFVSKYGIGLDALYSWQGQRYKFSGVEYTKSVDYIKIPVMFVYQNSFFPRAPFIFKIGPQIGLLTAAKLQDASGGNIIGNQKKAYNDIDYGAVAMAGFGLELLDNLYLDMLLRYDVSITNAENTSYNAEINNPNVNSFSSSTRAGTYNMTAGLTFGLRYLY